MIPKDTHSFSITVRADQRKTQITAFDSEKQVYKMDVSKPAENNEANNEIIRFFEKYFQKRVKIIVGKTSKHKTIKVIQE